MEKKKILVIDCNLADDMVFINLLMNKHEVDAVKSIDTAKWKLRSSCDYELIISEVSMPADGLYSKDQTSGDILTGFVFFFHEIERLKIPVIFWTASHGLLENFKNVRDRNPNSKLGFICKQTEENHLVCMIDLFYEKVLHYIDTEINIESKTIQESKNSKLLNHSEPYFVDLDRICY